MQAHNFTPKIVSGRFFHVYEVFWILRAKTKGVSLNLDPSNYSIE